MEIEKIKIKEREIEMDLGIISSKLWLNIGVILLVFIGAILRIYSLTHKVYYMTLLILCFYLVVMIINFYKHKIINKYFLLIFLPTLLFLVISSLIHHTLNIFVKFYIVEYLIVSYIYLSILKYGKLYVSLLSKCMTYMLNIFSIFNIYQVVFHKPMLYDFLTSEIQTLQYQVSTSFYRTSSVFGHAIVAGLFFVILFLHNFFTLKNKIFKYILQGIVLINLYSTMSRSAWLAFLVVIFILILINFKKINLIAFASFSNLSYRQILYTYLGVIIIAIGVLFIAQNYNSLLESIINRFGDSLSDNSTDLSNLQRTGTITAIFKFMSDVGMKNLIFGNGLGTVANFMLSHQIVIPDFLTTDNQYLTWYYEFGICGIFLVSLFFFMLIHHLIKFFMNKSYDWTQVLSVSCLIVLCIGMFFFEGIQWETVGVFLAINLGCILPVTNQNNINTGGKL
ncbi:O-antigen ligase family protein [Heyndrickxia coagulans]|uniref:O-antigen ligase family protein n=1 Tax=Heyndrickxia coagulans TaxID=1398 RepID=UPI002E0B5488|nr:O-antigen ligase family protein [Heyndrickxia coagulans]